MFGEKKGKKGDKFSGIAIEKINNGYIVGMLDQAESRTVNLEDSYVFETKEKAIGFIEKMIGTLVTIGEINEEDD